MVVGEPFKPRFASSTSTRSALPQTVISAGAIRNLEYDLIITGRQAIDGDTAQVGPHPLNEVLLQDRPYHPDS